MQKPETGACRDEQPAIYSFGFRSSTFLRARVFGYFVIAPDFELVRNPGQASRESAQEADLDGEGFAGVGVE